MNINERFKDCSPEQTVEKIRKILEGIGLTVQERWHGSGIDDCWSVTVWAQECEPFRSNGKGVTQALARASAYAELIERIQCGLLLYKFQSLSRTPGMDLHHFAPDARYMTMAELEQEGEWMDHVIAAYGGGLTRKKLAQLSKIYACTDEDKILTLPFYSLFEDKYVYIPAGIATCVYATNGCCAGNTREEAWVHAMSEMIERHSAQTRLVSGEAMPPIPEEVLDRFPTVKRILSQIRQRDKYHVTLLDLSMGDGFPVVAARVINKETQDYLVNIAADPVLEIAIDRTLTEFFQGRHVDHFRSGRGSGILKSITDVNYAHNASNQMENCTGFFTADFFAEELTCQRECAEFADNSNKSNKELLQYMLDLYRKMGRPVYVRNYSFLGFPSYHFIVPGFSEIRGYLLPEPVSEYALGEEAAKALRDPRSASIPQLAILLTYYDKIRTMVNRRENFSSLVGLPMDLVKPRHLLFTALSCAAWRLGRMQDAIGFLTDALRGAGGDRQYLSCLRQYLTLLHKGIDPAIVRSILEKSFYTDAVEKLYRNLLEHKDPYHGQLLRCSGTCEGCPHRDLCSFPQVREALGRVGAHYKTYTDGQSREHLAV